MKSRIIEELGQAELILPNLVAGALKANDRAKLRLSVLQAAVGPMRMTLMAFPPTCPPNVGGTGIDAAAARALVAGARTNGGGLIRRQVSPSWNEGLLFRRQDHDRGGAWPGTLACRRGGPRASCRP